MVGRLFYCCSGLGESLGNGWPSFRMHIDSTLMHIVSPGLFHYVFMFGARSIPDIWHHMSIVHVFYLTSLHNVMFLHDPCAGLLSGDVTRHWLCHCTVVLFVCSIKEKDKKKKCHLSPVCLTWHWYQHMLCHFPPPFAYKNKGSGPIYMAVIQ